jgi:hypothetical protein
MQKDLRNLLKRIFFFSRLEIRSSLHLQIGINKKMSTEVVVVAKPKKIINAKVRTIDRMNRRSFNQVCDPRPHTPFL